MSSIFGIVGHYKASLVMLPVAVLLFSAATLVLYLFFHQAEWLKYIPAALGIVLGIAFLMQGFVMKTTIAGLDATWKGIFFFVAGCIALATAWLTSLFESLARQHQEKIKHQEKHSN